MIDIQIYNLEHQVIAMSQQPSKQSIPISAVYKRSYQNLQITITLIDAENFKVDSRLGTLHADESLWRGTPFQPASFQKLVAELSTIKMPTEGSMNAVLITAAASSIEKKTFQWNDKNDSGKLTDLKKDIDHSFHVDFFASQELLKAGEKQIEAKVFHEAYKLLRQGIDLLSNSYASSDVLDETGTKLINAQQAVKQQDWESAANRYQRILESRLNIYSAKKLPFKLLESKK
jgi:hypothetical protein